MGNDMAEPRSQEYLKKPYARVLVPSAGGGFSARILEFPGCIAQGDTRDEALEALEGMAESWLDVALALGHTIHAPFAAQEYSGKMALHLPVRLHEQVVRIAAINHSTANEFIIAAIAEKVGQHAAFAELLPSLRDIVGESIRQVTESEFARSALLHATPEKTPPPPDTTSPTRRRRARSGQLP
jgi:predicted RNase H-like HicB family nuclease